MVRVDEAVVARLKKDGENFEVLVDCVLAMRLRDGGSVDMDDVLADKKIFADEKKGMRSAETSLQAVFGTTDAIAVAKEIILKGEIHLNTEYRAKLREEKRRKIIVFTFMIGGMVGIVAANGGTLTATTSTIGIAGDIALAGGTWTNGANTVTLGGDFTRTAVDPRSGLPHPVKRLELALEEKRVHIDESKSVEDQVDHIIKALQVILPMRFEKRTVEIRIPSQHAEKAFRLLGGYGQKMKDKWNDDGSYTVVVEIPAGLQNEFFDHLNNVTQGNNETRILNR